MPGTGKLTCLTGWKTIKDITGQFNNLLNVIWLVNPNSDHSLNVKNTIGPIVDNLVNGSKSITSISGTFHHTGINLTNSNTFYLPTKIWIKAGSTQQELLIARSWVNPIRNYGRGVEEFIEFMTIGIS